MHLAAVLCCASMLGCGGSSSKSSYRVDQFELRSEGGGPETIPGAAVGTTFFQENGAAPLVGRVFIPEEYKTNQHKAVVLAYTLWQRKFNSNPALIGRSLQLNGSDFTVVGIMPKDFAVQSGAELWIPKTE